MPLDYNILNNSKSLLDQTQMQQDFALRKQAAIMDAATKANALKYQLIAAGAANGADGLAQVKNKLGQIGIDASEYSDDPTQAAAQALAAQQATSPYGTLYNAALKDQSNQIALSGITGQVTPGALRPSLPSPALVQPQPVPQPQQQTAQPVPQQPVAQPILTRPQAANSIAVPQINDKIDAVPPAMPAMPNTQLTQPQSGFQFRPQNPTETAAKYNQERQAAIEEYKLSDTYAQGHKFSEDTGSNLAKSAQDAKAATQMEKRLGTQLEGMRTLNPSLPSTDYFDPQTKVDFWRHLPNFLKGDEQKMVNAADQFTAVDKQQVLAGLQEFKQSAGGDTKLNQFIDRVVTAANSIDMNSPEATRLNKINNLKVELHNLGVQARNIAGGNEPYQPLPVSTANPLQDSFDKQKAIANNPYMQELQRRGIK